MTWFLLLLANQMDKRSDDLYDERAFEAARPAVGSPSPDLALADLEGCPRSLSLWFGRTVVLVKGSYT
jgi:hypothetical protein